MTTNHLKDKFNRIHRSKLDCLIKSLSTILRSAYLPKILRLNAKNRLGALKRVLRSPRSICLASSRSRGVFRLFKLSRIQLREQGSLSQVPGLRKR